MKKRLLVTAGAAVMALGMSMSAMAADVPADTEAYFTFDETTDGATAVEKGADATVGGAAADKTWSYVDGMNGKAIVINDMDDQIGLDTNVTIGANDSFTVSFWAKAYTSPFAAPITWIGSTSQKPEDWIGIWAGFNNTGLDGWTTTAGIGSNDSAGLRVGAVSPLSEGNANSFNWTYITMTMDVADHIGVLYYNGAEVARTTDALPTLNDDSHVYICANAWDAPPSMEIDDFAIYKRALSAEEVKTLFSVNGVAEKDAKVVDQKETEGEKQEETTKAKVSTATPGVSNEGSTEVIDASNNKASTGLIIAIVAGVLVVAIVIAVVIATRKKR